MIQVKQKTRISSNFVKIIKDFHSTQGPWHGLPFQSGPVHLSPIWIPLAVHSEVSSRHPRVTRDPGVSSLRVELLRTSLFTMGRVPSLKYHFEFGSQLRLIHTLSVSLHPGTPSLLLNSLLLRSLLSDTRLLVFDDLHPRFSWLVLTRLYLDLSTYPGLSLLRVLSELTVPETGPTCHP